MDDPARLYDTSLKYIKSSNFDKPVIFLVLVEYKWYYTHMGFRPCCYWQHCRYCGDTQDSGMKHALALTDIEGSQ